MEDEATLLKWLPELLAEAMVKGSNLSPRPLLQSLSLYRIRPRDSYSLLSLEHMCPTGIIGKFPKYPGIKHKHMREKTVASTIDAVHLQARMVRQDSGSNLLN